MDRSLVLLVSILSETNQINQTRNENENRGWINRVSNYPGFASNVHSRSTDPVHSKFIRKLHKPRRIQKRDKLYVVHVNLSLKSTHDSEMNRFHTKILKPMKRSVAKKRKTFRSQQREETKTMNETHRDREKQRERSERSNHMYSAMIFSVASERLRLTRSESGDMAASERGIRRNNNNQCV